MKQATRNVRGSHVLATACLMATAVVCGIAGLAQAQTPAITKGNTTTPAVPATRAGMPAMPMAAATSSAEPSIVGPAMELTIGKSTLMRIPSAVERISVGNPGIADITLISPTEIYLLGKNYGSTNLLIWRKGGVTTVIDVNVNINIGRMIDKLMN